MVRILEEVRAINRGAAWEVLATYRVQEGDAEPKVDEQRRLVETKDLGKSIQVVAEGK